jgi:hypothetical protein
MMRTTRKKRFRQLTVEELEKLQPGYLLLVRLLDLGWGVRRWQEAAFRKVWTDKRGKTFVQVTVNDAYYDVKPEDVRVVEYVETPSKRGRRGRSQDGGG